LVPVPQ
jgi:RNA-binding protein NOB1